MLRSFKKSEMRMTASVLKQNPNIKGLKECLSKTQWHAEVLLNLFYNTVILTTLLHMSDPCFYTCQIHAFTRVRSMLLEETEVFILV